MWKSWQELTPSQRLDLIKRYKAWNMRWFSSAGIEYYVDTNWVTQHRFINKAKGSLVDRIFSIPPSKDDEKRFKSCDFHLNKEP